MAGEEHVTRWTPRVRMPYWTSAKYLRLLKHSLLFRVALGFLVGLIIYLSIPERSLDLDHGKKNGNVNVVDVFQPRQQNSEDGQDRLEVSTHTSRQRPGIEPAAIPLDKLPDVRPVRAASHQRFLTIATMMKNQRPWLREWLEFHLMMGTEHFILYDNGSEDLPLEILQPYIDRGVVTFIPWPPASVPPPPQLHTRLEEWQYQWFKDTLETCFEFEWPIHRHAPCQLAAFADAVRRSKDGVSRWLGILDIDEYIFPLPSSEFRTLANLLRFRHRDHDHVRIFGATFGTGGHIHHAARRREGDPLQALMTESYVYRSVLDHEDEHPLLELEGEYKIRGKGLLGELEFSDGDGWVSKAFADPDMVSHSWIHSFFPPEKWSDWKTIDIWPWAEDAELRYNHYPFLSKDDVRRKSQENRNPFLASWNDETDDFFNSERDTEIFAYLPELKDRMWRAIEENPPIHPDDWRPHEHMD